MKRNKILFWGTIIFLVMFTLILLQADCAEAKGFQTDSLRVTTKFEVGNKGSAINIFPFLENITGSTFYFSALPDSARGIGLASNWVRMLSQSYRFSTDPTAPGTNYRMYVPWIAGQTEPNIFVGSSNASNTSIGIRAESYDNYALYGLVGGSSSNSIAIYGQAPYGITGGFLQGTVLTASSTAPAVSITRLAIPGAYDMTGPLLRVQDSSTGDGTTGNLIEAKVGSNEYFVVGKDSVTEVQYLKLATLDTNKTTVTGGEMAFDGVYGWMYDGTEWLKMTFAASGGVTITEVRSEIADSLDTFRADSLLTWVTTTQLADSMSTWKADSVSKWVTLTQLADSLGNFARVADSLTKWVTFSQLADSAAAIRAAGGGGGVTDFVSLTDTPADYTDDAGKYVLVNDAEDALEFTHNPYVNYYELDAAKNQTDLDSALTAIEAIVGTDFVDVFLQPGTYVFSSTGARKNKIRIRGSNTNGKQIYRSSDPTGQTIIQFSDDMKISGNFTLEDVTCTVVGSASVFAIFYIEYSSNVVYDVNFRNVTFADVTGNNLYASPSWINSTEPGTILLENCGFYGSISTQKYNGIYISDDGVHVVVDGCIFQGMNNGAWFNHPATGSATNVEVIVKDCIFDENDIGINFEPSLIASPDYRLINNVYTNNDEYDIEFDSGVLNVFSYNDKAMKYDFTEGSFDFNFYKDDQVGAMTDATGSTFTAQTGYLLLGGKYGAFTYSEEAQTGAYTTPTWFYDYTDSTLTIPSDWPGTYMFEAQIYIEEGTTDDDYSWAVDIDGTQYNEILITQVGGDYHHIPMRYIFKATGGEVVGMAVKAPNGNSAFDVDGIIWTLTRVGDISSIN